MDISASPPNPSSAMADPRLKSVCYLLMERMRANNLVNRFEILENDVYWEFPVPNIESPYQYSITVPHERVVGEPWVVMAEVMAKVYKDIQRINGATDPRVAARFGRGPV